MLGKMGMGFGRNKSCALFLALMLLPLFAFCGQELVDEYSKAAYYIAPGGLGTPSMLSYSLDLKVIAIYPLRAINDMTIDFSNITNSEYLPNLSSWV